MSFAVRFYDRADRADIRKIHMDAHLQWLESVRSGVLIAGSLREHATAHPDGALWIVEAASKEAVETLLKQDPFWQEGCVKTWISGSGVRLLTAPLPCKLSPLFSHAPANRNRMHPFC
ncbi:YciI family protein [Pantoea stewartii]|uniref:YciI family protein n=1 Tax=Pantoea stewartii TaxID=66269 RepID=UPI00345C0C58